MKKYRFLILFISISFILFHHSCVKKEDISEIPEIEYISFTKLVNNKGVNDKGILKFSFKDKDGDIGFDAEDTLPPHDHNLFITFYEYYQGNFREKIFPDSTQNYNTRIPNITPKGQNKMIKGEVEIEIFMYDYNLTKPYDTIYIEVFIRDRALNQSNTIKTKIIEVKRY